MWTRLVSSKALSPRLGDARLPVSAHGLPSVCVCILISLSLSLFFFFGLFRATPAAYGGS